MAQSVKEVRSLPLVPVEQDEPIGLFGIGKHSTVSRGRDNGANKCIRQHLSKAMAHSTTTEAVDNWLKRLKKFSAFGKDGLILSGHGAAGLVETGAGQNGPWEAAKFIALWLESVWGPQLDRLPKGKYPSAQVISCDTGAGDEGADLLFAMAKHMGCAVQGRTGITYCSGARGIWYAKGSKWQTATPTHRPDSIGLTTNLPMNEQITVALSAEAVREITADEVNSIYIIDHGFPGLKREERSGSIEAKFFEPILRALFASKPHRAPGTPLGILTHTISIDVEDEPTPLEISVINGRLAHQENLDVIYECDPNLKSVIDHALG